ALASELLGAVAWEREQSRLSALAAAWQDSGKSDAHLLDAASCSAAEAWASRRPPNVESLRDHVLQLLAASRHRLRESDAALLHRRLAQRGFIAPALAALEEKQSAAALRRLAAGALLTGDPSLSLDADADETHRFALWRAALR